MATDTLNEEVVTYKPKIELVHYNLNDMLIALQEKLLLGYQYSDGNSYKVGSGLHVILTHPTTIAEQLAKEAEEKLEEAKLYEIMNEAIKEDKRLSDEKAVKAKKDSDKKLDEVELPVTPPTEVSTVDEPVAEPVAEPVEEPVSKPVGDPVEDKEEPLPDSDAPTLDEATKALVEIDWDLLNAKAGEDDRAFIKEYAKKFNVNLPKNMSAVHQVEKFKKAVDKI